MSRARETNNAELMQTLDDAWNTQDWDTFDSRHKEDTVVLWPAQPPTHGRHDHHAEAVDSVPQGRKDHDHLQSRLSDR